jgi:hypothetical protein
MRWHVKTRSRNKDYLFVGGAPERWWARFGVDTSFERPTLLVERPGAGGGWRLLASGIPSVRKDLHQTTLRYTVVGEGEIGEGGEPARRLVATWLEAAAAILAARDGEAAPGPEAAPLSRALDEVFPEDVIEGWLSLDPGAPELGDEAERLLLDAIARLPSPPEPADPCRGVAGWYGSLHATACRAAFLERVGELLDGRAEGAACLLNLVDRAEQLKSDLDDQRAAVLFDVPPDQVDAPAPLRRAATSPAKKKGADPGRDGRRGPDDTPRPPRQPVALGGPGDPADARGGGGGDTAADPLSAPAATPECGPAPEERPPAVEAAETAAGSGDAGPPDPDGGEPTQAGQSGLLRRALPGADVVRKVREAGRDTLGEVLGAGRDTLEEVLGAGRDTLEEVLGSSRQTLEHLRKEVKAGREGASRGAREVIEAVVTGTRALSHRVEEIPQLLGVEPAEGGSGDGPPEPTVEPDEEPPDEPTPDEPTGG